MLIANFFNSDCGLEDAQHVMATIIKREKEGHYEWS